MAPLFILLGFILSNLFVWSLNHKHDYSYEEEDIFNFFDDSVL